jgi:hypothetical protein
VAGTQRLIVIPYAPRRQFLPFHARTERWGVMVAHRRAGKTVACINDLIRAAVRCDKPDGRYAYCAPLYAQAKDVAWSYLKKFTAPIPGVEVRESELRIDLPNGARVRLYGLDNYERLRGNYFDGLVIDEFGDADPRAWTEVIRPALSDRKGWAVFVGTPKGANHFEKLWIDAQEDPAWFKLMLKASETGIVSDEELADARRMMTPDQYEQEYQASFTANVVGSYYGALLQQAQDDGRITRVAYEVAKPVETWWDLGVGDSTAIWFAQRVNSEVRLIDFHEATGEGLPHYARLLQSKPYVYSRHVAPHDIKVRELGSGRSRLETAADLGLRFDVAPNLPIDDGIHAVRMLLPRCWFDAEKCRGGLDALRQYRKDWDERLKVFRSRPLHNWASHTADSFRMGAVSLETDRGDWSRPLKADVGWIV